MHTHRQCMAGLHWPAMRDRRHVLSCNTLNVQPYMHGCGFGCGVGWLFLLSRAVVPAHSHFSFYTWNGLFKNSRKQPPIGHHVMHARASASVPLERTGKEPGNPALLEQHVPILGIRQLGITSS